MTRLIGGVRCVTVVLAGGVDDSLGGASMGALETGGCEVLSALGW